VDYRTDISVEEALARTQVYFARDWPFGGRYIRNGNELICTVQVNQGCLAGFLDFFLTTITLYMRDPKGPEHQVTRLLAYPKEGQTILTATTTVPEHGEALERWLVEELGARRA
jgi:hypothetical protein